ncbi:MULTISPECIES: ORF6C domain-containing protein [Clostridium]|uniref:ORF6C domain-containing protein n=1 Tax=Clostridium TaxID=1485 RepID=UPI00096AC6A5|nr:MULTISPECIES: ORF6C domain-containing protein [Clostridium]MDU2284082.1 ORF6C domain-containing protein [Clostridium sp.]MDU3600288.1 ORF6C domain-containing protein [Clostridium perfringens]
MSNLMVFNNQDFGQVRTVNIEGKPYFVGKDIAEALGYKLPRKAISDHCKGVLKQNILTDGGLQEMLIIPEGDIYRLIIKSKLPQAEKFESWVFDEVLPQIRKTGQYQVKPKSNLDLLELQVKALKEVEEKVTDLDEKFEDFKEDLPLIGDEPDELVALVKQKGVEVLGGKDAKAYKDKSLRSKVYSDIWGEVKRQFGVRKYKAIKRKHFDKAKEIVSRYNTTVLLAEEISLLNDQIDLLRG